MSVEREYIEPRPVSTYIDVPGLIPEMRDRDGRVIVNGNLEEKLLEIKEKFDKKPFLGRLISDIHDSKKVAKVVPVLGGVIIFSAFMGVELGIRHGKDFKELYDRVQNLTHPKQEE